MTGITYPPEMLPRQEDGDGEVWVVTKDLWDEAVPCRFFPACSDTATAVYFVPKGCICWTDPVQALCDQHAYKAESDGPVRRIARLGGSA